MPVTKVDNNVVYLGNPKIRPTGVRIEYTRDELQEYLRCKDNPIYFLKYIKINHVDKGLIFFEPYEYQVELIQIMKRERFVIVKNPRQTGKTTAVIALLLHEIVFKKNRTIGILAHKAEVAQGILDRLKVAYENLPKYLQQGVVSWNKKSIELENGSRVLTFATSSSAARSNSFSILYIDESAFVANSVWDSFWKSVYPTISSGTETKVLIVSTPQGLNHFYKMWKDAEKGKSSFVPFNIEWNDIPGRDEEWKRQTIANVGQETWNQEFECVTGDTFVEIKDSINQIYHLPIENLYNFKDHSKYRVRTVNGWEPYLTVRKSTNIVYKVLAGSYVLKCTSNHRLKTPDGFRELFELKVGDEVLTEIGYVHILSIDNTDEICDVYDVVEAGKDHCYYTNGILSHNCQFVGSSNTLIVGEVLRSIVEDDPILTNDTQTLRIYEQPDEMAAYVVVVDTSHGIGEDYCTATVIKISDDVYSEVAVFQDNEISILDFPDVIHKLSLKYNNAKILIEINDLGYEVGRSLQDDYDNQNIIYVVSMGRAGQLVVEGPSERSAFGVKMSPAVKSSGCAHLKRMIENGKYKVRDFRLLSELTTFVKNKKSFEAEEGANDDLVMNLVSFAWLTTQEQFKNIVSQYVSERKNVTQKKMWGGFNPIQKPDEQMDNGSIIPGAYKDEELGGVWVPVDDFDAPNPFFFGSGQERPFR